jgi:hypothetical protein
MSEIQAGNEFKLEQVVIENSEGPNMEKASGFHKEPLVGS